MADDLAPVALGLIGCGSIARNVHLKVLRRLPGVRVAALADPDAQRLNAAQRLVPGAAGCADYRQLLDLPHVQAVVIAAPNAHHAEMTVAALDRRKHVYLEKPIATSLAGARQILAAAQQAGTVGMMGFNYRFNPLYQETRRLIRSGRLGELVSVRSVFATASHPLPDWKQSRHSGGGVLLDLASHHVDLVRHFLGGEVRAVFATVRSLRHESDTATLQLELAGGLLVQSFFSWSAVEEDRFEVYGTAGRLAVHRYDSLAVELCEAQRSRTPLKRLAHAGRSLARSSYLLKKRLAAGHEPSYAAALAHFVAAVRGQASASPDFRDGYLSLAVIVAAEESAASGQTVLLPKPEEAGILTTYERAGC